MTSGDARFDSDRGTPSDGLPDSARAPQLAEQTVVFGRYRILRELGRGGMGVVYLARDEELGIDVAIKLLPDLVFQDDESLGELKREVLRGIALTHPGIVRTYSFARDATMAGIVMEYIDGGTLTLLKRQQPGGCFDAEDLLPWLEQLCQILDFAHFEARIAHRDLKPRNLMFTSAGYLKVADFGISSTLVESVSRVSVQTHTSGTLAYMSPQQVMGGRPSHLDDIYSLGATIYELLTGKPPFHRGQVVAQVMDAVVPSMAERRIELEVEGKNPIPAAWERTVAACLAKGPASRPQSAGDVLAGLAAANTLAVEEDVQLPARPDPTVGPIAPAPDRMARKARWGAAAAGVAALALIASVLHFGGMLGKRTSSANTLREPNGSVSQKPDAPQVPPAGPAVSPGTLPKGTPKPDGDGVASETISPPSQKPANQTPPGTNQAEGRVPAPVGQPAPPSPDTSSEVIVTKRPPGPDSPGAVVPSAAAGPKASPALPTRLSGLPLAEAKAEDLAAARLGDLRGLDLGAGVGMTFCAIPAGRFVMGSPLDEPHRNVYETQHEVTLTKAFWLARTEVTQAQWQAVMGSNPSWFKGRDLPVETISWDEAADFCRKLTELERVPGTLPAGWEFALPTEAQWEYACRAGTTGPYAGGRILGEMGWFEGNGDWITHPVGTKKANAWGLQDMLGNVWEWCADWHAHYPPGSVTDPTGPDSGSVRVLRGGTVTYQAIHSRAALRSSMRPDQHGTGVTGFRPALVPSRFPGPSTDGSGGTAGAAGSAANTSKPPASDAFRNWTDTSGKVIEARMVGTNPGSGAIRLRLRTGNEYDIPPARLCEADRIFAAAWKPPRVQGQNVRDTGNGWRHINDKRSSQERNASIDLVRFAVRRPPDKPDAIEFLATFRKGTPDHGVLLVYIDGDQNPATGIFGGDLVVKVDEGQKVADVTKCPGGQIKTVPAKQARVERLQDQILVHVDGWTLDKFDYFVRHVASTRGNADFPCPPDKPGKAITVDGRVGDWDGTEPVWKATEAELPITYCLTDPRRIWACRRGNSLFLSIRYPDHAVLWEQDGDIGIASSGVEIRVVPAGASPLPKICCFLPNDVSEWKDSEKGMERVTPPHADFRWKGSDMEIEVRDLPAVPVASQIRLYFISQKSDDIQGGVFDSGKKSTP